MKTFSKMVLPLVLAISACTVGPAESFFSNPVIGEDLADPSVIRVGESYYACASSYNWAPAFPLFRSEDLVNWEQVGNIFQTKPEWTDTGFWAPELFEHNGRYFCYYSAGRACDGKHCIGVAVSDSPEGPFEDKGVLIDCGTEQIDSHVFDDNGQLYITWKAHGLDQCPIEISCSRLSDDGLSLQGETFCILRDDERIGMEGQCMLKRDGWYYVLYSAKACCGPGSDYEVRLARARSIDGQWEKCPSNPILSGDGMEVQSLGHGTAVETPDGRLFYLCHAYVPGDEFYLSRRPFLSELRSNADGWLECVTGPKAAIGQKAPFAGTVQHRKAEVRHAFPEADDDPSWTFPVAQGGFSVLCKRPFAVDYTVSATLREDAGNDDGIIFFGSYGDYVSLCAEGSEIVLKSVSGGSCELLASWPRPAGEIMLIAAVSRAVNADFCWSCGDQSGSHDKTVGLAHLMRWDSCFRPGICSASADPRASLKSFELR